MCFFLFILLFPLGDVLVGHSVWVFNVNPFLFTNVKTNRQVLFPTTAQSQVLLCHKFRLPLNLKFTL